jgi:glycosyltransferase involved in cell wall biosynthesis
VKVVVLTTSWPRNEDDWAGRFVADAVDRLLARGVDVDVVAPGRFRDFGLAYGHGVVRNARRRPWALPPMLASMVATVRRAARDADLVHAHWLPAGAVAAVSGRPFVVTLHGRDMELARRAAPAARLVLRRARVVVAVSRALAEQARRFGAGDVRVVPNGVDFPAQVGEESDPPEVLFAGRLSPEKGIDDLLAAADGLRLVVAGDGPLRDRVPGALGFVSRDELARLYGRAAVVACPSRREGLGVVCAEAMAHARPVVASAVGGLLDLVVDGETGLLVPPGDRAALRASLERLIADRALRRRLGAAGRERIAALCAWERVTDATLDAYSEALANRGRAHG